MLPVKYFMHFGIVDINYMYVDSVFPNKNKKSLCLKKTGTPSAPTLKDRMFVAVKRVMLAMVKTAQILMNVPLQTIVTATPYVPTLKGPTSVGVSKVLRAMEETAQLFQLAVVHRVALTLFVRKVFNFLYVCAIWVTKGTDTTVQMSMSVKIPS